MNFNTSKTKFLLLSVLFTFSSCASNLLPPSIDGEFSDEDTTKGIELLKSSMKSQGFESFYKHGAYEFTGQDSWQGFMGTMGKLWPEKESILKFTYPTDSFDGQVEYLDGDEKGFVGVLDKKMYYTKYMDHELKEEEKDARVIFGIEAYKFFGEMLPGVLTAGHIAWIGTEEYNGQIYDLVFATWGTIEPNDEYDQYVLYINKETNFLDRATYTIRKNYMSMPGDGMLYGNIVFSNYVEVDGFKYAKKQTIFAFDVEDPEDYLHELNITDFKFTTKAQLLKN